jgi:hypothetical protein
MLQASDSQILQWKGESFLRLFASDIWPCVWSWLLIASVFIVLGVMTIKAPTSLRVASMRLFMLSVACAVVGAVVHFLLSSGEAWTSRVNPYRALIYYSLTAVFCTVSIYVAWRTRRQRLAALAGVPQSP